MHRIDRISTRPIDRIHRIQSRLSNSFIPRIAFHFADMILGFNSRFFIHC